MTTDQSRVIPLERLRMTDVDEVGGKNASLGEMISQLAGAGIRVPGGFATTADGVPRIPGARATSRGAHRRRGCAALDVDDVTALAAAGAEIRRWLAEAPLPPALDAGDPRRLRGACRGRGATRRSPCARRRPPRTCPTRPSPGSRKHFLISMA